MLAKFHTNSISRMLRLKKQETTQLYTNAKNVCVARFLYTLHSMLHIPTTLRFLCFAVPILLGMSLSLPSYIYTKIHINLRFFLGKVLLYTVSI